jgi:hypothetical protein
MRWFRIRLVETDFPTTAVGPDGVPLTPPRIRVPASNGAPFIVPFAHVLHAARGAAALDGLIGVRSATFTSPGDWTALDLDAAKLAYLDILGVEPLAGQVS